MRTNTLQFTKTVLSVICLLAISTVYSQNKKLGTKTAFGKTVKSAHPINGKIRCATVEYEKYLQNKNPKRMTSDQFESWIAPLVTKQATARTTAKTTEGTVITIPVVVHVIHSGQPIGTAPNITDAQVQSQISVLNQDYRKMLGTPGYNTNPVGADIQIEFVLAKQDPSGNPTTGIDRVNMCKSSWADTEIDDAVKPATIWNPNEYLNMWTVKFSSNDLLGYAQFPSASGLPGTDPFMGNDNTDGVVSSFDVFGSKAFGSNFLLQSSYDKGRTMTHEVGHYLGLLHIWGDGSGDEDSNKPDCEATDHCADTPPAGWAHYDCKSTYDTCPSKPGNDMPENYMDYSDDSCMNIFTQNQKDRVLAVLKNSDRRKTLASSPRGQAINPVANDAEIKNLTDFCTNSITTCSALPAPANKKITLTNRGTSPLTSVNLKYSINQGADQFQIWTGSLAQNQSAIVTLLNTASNGVLKTNVETANSVADERTSNNSDTKSYSPLNYNTANYVFTLQPDFWGSEIKWSLKDGSGSTKYSGGPYKDKAESTLILPALITQNWTLARNQCYTFTIEDSESDGICCGGGLGYYNIKSATGAETIASASTYGQGDIVFFTTNSLSKDEFETSNEILAFPNPTKGLLSIQIPSNIGMPNSYVIKNVLGQNVIEQNVSNESNLVINTSSLSNGIYFITLMKSNLKRTLQFIKE